MAVASRRLCLKCGFQRSLAPPLPPDYRPRSIHVLLGELLARGVPRDVALSAIEESFDELKACRYPAAPPFLSPLPRGVCITACFDSFAMAGCVRMRALSPLPSLLFFLIDRRLSWPALRRSIAKRKAEWTNERLKKHLRRNVGPPLGVCCIHLSVKLCVCLSLSLVPPSLSASVLSP